MNKPENKKAEGSPEDVKKLTTTFVDTYFLTLWRGHVKIVFGEEIDGEEQFRLSIILPTVVAANFAAQLDEIIQRRVSEGKEDLEREEKG